MKPSEHLYDLFGVKIQMRTNSARFLEEARLFLQEHEVDMFGEPRYRLFVEETHKPLANIPDSRPCRGRECRILEQGDTLFVSAAEGVARLDLRDRTARGYVFPWPNGRCWPRASVPIIHPLIHRIMFAEDLLSLHAAGVLLPCRPPDSRFNRSLNAAHAHELLLISGSKGIGKSTLAYIFHRQGFPLVSDDLLYLKTSRGHLYAGGHCQPIKLRTAEHGPLPPDCIPWAGQAGVRGKTLVSARRLNPHSLNRLYPVRALVYLENSRERPTRTSIATDQRVRILQHLLGDTALSQAPGYHARALDSFCADNHTRYYLARPGTDPLETTHAILKAVEQT